MNISLKNIIIYKKIKHGSITNIFPLKVSCQDFYCQLRIPYSFQLSTSLKRKYILPPLGRGKIQVSGEVKKNREKKKGGNKVTLN